MFRYGLTTDDKSLVDLVVLPRGSFVLTGGWQREVVTVHLPNTFYPGQKFIVASTPQSVDGTRLFKVERSSENIVAFSGGAYNFQENALLVNLGSDTGTTTPNWDGSSELIYQTPSVLGPVYEKAVVPAARARTEGFYGSGDAIWTVGRSKTTKPLFVAMDLGATEVPDTAPPAPTWPPFVAMRQVDKPTNGALFWIKPGPPDVAYVYLQQSDGTFDYVYFMGAV